MNIEKKKKREMRSFVLGWVKERLPTLIFLTFVLSLTCLVMALSAVITAKSAIPLKLLLSTCSIVGVIILFFLLNRMIPWIICRLLIKIWSRNGSLEKMGFGSKN